VREIGGRRAAACDQHQERCRACNPFHDDLHTAAQKRGESKSRGSHEKNRVIATATMSNLKLNLSEFLKDLAIA
jgi:hypothetical protein